jgi:hypothetical protein
MRKSCSPRAIPQVAPMDNFKSAVHHVQQRGGGGGGAAAAVWETGISSEVTELPAGFEHRTMLVAGKGITATMDAWGTALRKAYGTNHSAVFDRNIEYLSYWTDNGAYYSVRKACVFAPVYTQKIFLPSQARDKHKETLERRGDNIAGWGVDAAGWWRGRWRRGGQRRGFQGRG